MYNEYLSFEKPIAEITAQINELQAREHSASPDIQERILKLEQQNKKQTQQIFSKLTDHQIVELARHPLRPHSTDYISQVFDTFEPMSGDRRSGKSHAIIGGIARLNGMSVMVIAQERGRETDEKIARNFGMPKPECYRFALRLFHIAEKSQLPIISFCKK